MLFLDKILLLPATIDIYCIRLHLSQTCYILLLLMVQHIIFSIAGGQSPLRSSAMGVISNILLCWSAALAGFELGTFVLQGTDSNKSAIMLRLGCAFLHSLQTAVFSSRIRRRRLLDHAGHTKCNSHDFIFCFNFQHFFFFFFLRVGGI